MLIGEVVAMEASQTKTTQIKMCSVSNCVYNMENNCHTPGINVGPHAECSTFLHGTSKGGFTEVEGTVGACQASDCKYNDKLECRAPNIDVALHSIHADCKTYEPR